MTLRRRPFLALPALAALGASTPGLAAAPVLTRVETSLGNFTVAVDLDVAPVTVANYLSYVDGRHLDGSWIYRIVNMANQPPETKHKIEVVQWGMKLSEGQASPFPPIMHETTKQTGLKHLDGTVSMARSTPGSAAGEFFICIGDQPELDFGGRRNPDGQGFAAFGRVVDGMNVVREIHQKGGAQQMLADPLPIRRVRRATA